MILNGKTISWLHNIFLSFFCFERIPRASSDFCRNITVFLQNTAVLKKLALKIFHWKFLSPHVPVKTTDLASPGPLVKGRFPLSRGLTGGPNVPPPWSQWDRTRNETVPLIRPLRGHLPPGEGRAGHHSGSTDRKPRRGNGTAPAAIFTNPGPSGPAGI